MFENEIIARYDTNIILQCHNIEQEQAIVNKSIPNRRRKAHLYGAFNQLVLLTLTQVSMKIKCIFQDNAGQLSRHLYP